jgi:hypothetical protein
LNETLDRLNHPTGPHAFDIMDDSDTSREAFLRFHLKTEPRP